MPSSASLPSVAAFRRLLTAVLLAAVLLLPTAAHLHAAAEPERSAFTLRQPAAPDTVVYTATREVRTEAGRVTERTVFSDAQGRAVQRTEAVFEAESLAPVSYHLEDLRSGEMEDLRREGNQVHMRYRERTGAKEKTGTETYVAGMLFSPTVSPFIKRNLERLRKGETVEFKFLVPSRQDVFTFRIQLDTERTFGVPALVVRMDPGTWLIRQLVDPLFFVLNTAPPHDTLLFEGRSSVKAEDGADQVLRYDFR